MPSVSSRQYNGLPPVSPPPAYNELPLGKHKYEDGSYISNRRMGQRGGLPQGINPSRNRSADRRLEWDPGEFERSYPKSDPRNREWYKQHVYGRLPGTNIDGWMRRVGPFPSEAGASQAIARRAGKGNK